MSSGSIFLYCVDGTNIVRGGYGYGGPAFREQEDADAERLVAALDELCARLGPRIEIEVFFDGPLRKFSCAAANLRARFTREEPADELIVDRVRSKPYTSAGGSVTVVTGDSELGRRAADEGGRWLKVKQGADLENVIAAIERRWLK